MHKTRFRILSIIGILFLIFAIAVSIFLVQHSTELRKRAFDISIAHTNIASKLIYPHHTYKRECRILQKGHVKCLALVTTDKFGEKLIYKTPLDLVDQATKEQNQGTAVTPIDFDLFSPLRLHDAYKLPCVPGGPVQKTCPSSKLGSLSYTGPIIAIINAFDDPTIESDLGVYSNQYHLPPCTKRNGCLTVVDQTGQLTRPSTPPKDDDWNGETAMDVEVVHALCQSCRIVLVEANDDAFENMAIASNYAASMNPPPVSVSMSFGDVEDKDYLQYTDDFNHPNIAMVAPTGDNCYAETCHTEDFTQDLQAPSQVFGVEMPAAFPTVVAVGGTKLELNTDATYNTESVWDAPDVGGGGGGGCSQLISANPWQLSLSNWNDTGCGNKRAVADVSAMADPDTGIAVYNSSEGGWEQMGGTSLATPIIASTFALTGRSIRGNAQQLLYKNANRNNFHDIVVGQNGDCNTSICKAEAGYDGPTGVGTPNGVRGFE